MAGTPISCRPSVSTRGKLLEEQGILDPPRVLRFAAMTKLGMDNQEIADLPDLGGIFEANQADSRKRTGRCGP